MNRAALILGLATVALLQGCESSEKRAIESLVNSAKTLVARDFTDPSSAQFREIRIDRQKKIYCGEVNVKNELGGYVGFKRFRLFSPVTEENSFSPAQYLVIIDRIAPPAAGRETWKGKAWLDASNLEVKWQSEQQLLAECKDVPTVK